MRNKKLILTGPPGTGKTSLKRVYFENANPLKLLEDSLEPTRGVKSSVYSLFQQNLGVFDFAGQENERWFSTESDKFNDSSLIICVFDIRNTLKTIIDFLMKILNMKGELQLYDCRIILFLHKIDLVKRNYLSNKVKALKKFIEVKIPEASSLDILLTSIAKDYFFNTYCIFLDILNLIFKQGLIPIQKSLLDLLKIDLSILLKFDNSCIYSWNILKSKFNLEFDKALSHLERLCDLGLLKIHNLQPFTFRFTDRAKIFKMGLEMEISKIEESRLDKGIELYYTFLNLKKTHSYS